MRDYRNLLQIVTGESSGDAGLQDSIPGMSCQDSIPHANLRGADLQGADLRGANLRGANLRFPILQDARARNVMTTTDDLWVQLKQAERDLASRASLYEAGACSEDQFRERVQIYRAARAAYLERSTGVDLA